MSENSLALVLMSKNGSWRLERAILSVIDRVDEIVVAVDSASSDDTFERASKYTNCVLSIDNPQGIVEPHIETLHRHCNAKWILRLDDDEIMSSNFALSAISKVTLDNYDLIGFPRPWIVCKVPAEFVGTGENVWTLNPQYRLSRRSATLDYVSTVHTPGFEMKVASVVSDMFIYHMDLVDTDLEYRQTKFDRYQALADRPWNRDYLLDAEKLHAEQSGTPCDANMPAVRDIYCYDDKTMPAALRCVRESHPPLSLIGSTASMFDDERLRSEHFGRVCSDPDPPVVV